MRLALMLMPVLLALPSAQVPSFEVVSIKQNKAGVGGMIGPRPGGHFSMNNGTIRMVLDMAYNLPLLDEALANVPDWVQKERYDIDARSAPGASESFDDVRAKLRALLTDRFKLVAHIEQREHPIYALVVARADGRLGPKLRASTVDCDARRKAIAAGTAPPLTPPPPTGELPPCTTRQRGNSLASSGMTMSVLARMLGPSVGRPVADKTGLAGGFDFDLGEYAPPGAASSDPPSPSIFTALQENLGLKLESTKGAVDVLVIDRIERPTEN